MKKLSDLLHIRINRTNDPGTRKDRGRYSFRSRLFHLLNLIIAIQIIGFLCYSAYFMVQIRERTYSEARQTLELYNAQVSENLKGVDYFLMEINNYSPDISLLGTQKNLNGNYGSIARINKLFDFNLRSFGSIIGLYAFFPVNGTWIGNDSGSSVSGFQKYLKNSLSEADSAGRLSSVNGTQWVLYPYKNRNYLVKVFVLNNSIVGAWTDTDRLISSLTDLHSMNSLILYTDHDGHPITTSEIPDLPDIPISKTLDHYVILSYMGNSYLAVSSRLDYCDYDITAMIPLHMIDAPLYSLMRMLALILGITLLVSFIIRKLLSNFFSDTIGSLENLSDSVAKEGLTTRASTENQQCVEILEISTSYNHMLDIISQLKIDVYEEQLQRKNLQLQYLKSQIAPHFLINCLNMISYLADGTKEHAQLLQKMIVALSDHLRYTLRTEERVPLRQELEYEKNYCTLNELRFPGCLACSFDFDDDVLEAQVFPLILIMFTENTFKFNLIMGEPLELRVSAKIRTVENGKRLHLTHIDSGEGFSRDIMEEYNAVTGGAPLQNTNHIGIINLWKRLQLYYSNSAVMQLSNEPGYGARIDIDIPYIRYEKNSPDTGSREGGST